MIADMKNLEIDAISDFISSLPITMYVGLTYIAFITMDLIYFKMIAIMLLSTVLTDIIKRFPYSMCGDTIYKLSRRPDGACNCDYLSKAGKCAENANGFPSGHMSTTTSFSVLMILFFMKRYNVSFMILLKNNPMIVFISSLLVPSMAWSRYYKKCHSILQIVVGILLGGTLPIILF